VSFRLYITRANRTRVFLCTVRVTTLADAVECCRAYRGRIRKGDRFHVKPVVAK
jgi:hypothetical protein